MRDLQKRLGRWLVNQHEAQWRGLGDTQRQAREFISGPSLGARAKFFTFNRTQSRAVTGLLTGHNTLRRHLYLLWLLDSPMCRKCGVREETSVHILLECEALASLRHAYLISFLLEPEGINPLNAEFNPICHLLALLGAHHILHVSRIRVKSLGLGPSGTIVRLRGSRDLIWGTKGPLNQGLGASGLRGPQPKCKSINQSINQGADAIKECYF